MIRGDARWYKVVQGGTRWYNVVPQCFFCSGLAEHFLSTKSEYFLDFGAISERSKLSTFLKYRRSEHLRLSTFFKFSQNRALISEHYFENISISEHYKLSPF